MLQKKSIIISAILFISLMLSGCLETVFVGTVGTVTELAKDRSPADALKDLKIATAIKASLIKKNFRDLYTKIKIEVIQGRVLFTGTIDSDRDAIIAVEVAWSQEGVTEVINELKVDKNSNKFDLFQYTRDSMITSQIKTKVFVTREIKFINYTVITLNDRVYLFGIARSEEELEKVASIASNINGVQQVISHVKVQHRANKAEPNPMIKEDGNNNLLIDNDNNNEDDLNLDRGI